MKGEKKITNQILAYLKSIPNTWCAKIHGGPFQQAGIPDIVGCHRGRLFALEVKSGRGKASKIQNIVMEKIAAAGGIVGIVRSLEDVKVLIDEAMGSSRSGDAYPHGPTW